jgi:hypothetical protein
MLRRMRMLEKVPPTDAWVLIPLPNPCRTR